MKILTLSLLLACGAVVHAQKPSKPESAEFLAFLAEADAAQVLLHQGKSDAYKSMWSHSDSVTLSGGFGGKIERGWTDVSNRLDWAGTQFSNGTSTIERVTAYDDRRIGYLVQIEHIKFKVPTTGLEATRDFRVTMIFRRENGKWKIVHRHADGQTTKQPA